MRLPLSFRAPAAPSVQRATTGRKLPFWCNNTGTPPAAAAQPAYSRRRSRAAPLATAADCVSTPQVSDTHARLSSITVDSWDGTSLDSMDSSFRDSVQVLGLVPTSVQPIRATARILQGAASVRGLLKHENQDRLCPMASLHSPAPAASASAHATMDARNNPQRSWRGPASSSTSSSGSHDVYFSAVYDGHGGSNAATQASRRLQHILQGEAALLAALDTMCDPSEDGCAWGTAQESTMQDLWSQVFDTMDTEILDQSRASGKIDGTTALVGVHAGPSLVVANAGDCRAVLGRGGYALRLTSDHKPGEHGERARIEAAGGTVRHLKGSWRVLLPNHENTEVKICATSRGLGDLDFKERNLISCQPQMTRVSLLPYVDNFSVFASDGVWGYVEDQEVVDTVTRVLDQFSRMSRPDLQVAASAAAQAVIKLSLDKGSVDDISVLVHVYDWQPSPST